MVLGRSSSADAYINSASVSRRHAQIDAVKDGDEEYYTLTDLGSSNGTLVNSQPAQHARLHPGDRILMGDVLLKFLLRDGVDAQYHQEVHRLIHYDQLTGLLTMEAFRGRMETIIHRSKSTRPFSLAMTDLDGLKRVNDTHGHLAGRMIVREMGSMMRETIRPKDLAALYGGDEAVIVFTNAQLEEATAVAQRLRSTIEARVFEHEGNDFQVTISQGLAEWPRHGESLRELIATADRALYKAKASGRNCVVSADDAEA